MIGIFDSGVGGLGVLAEVRRLLPLADLVYVADEAAAPYGTRTLNDVRARSGLISDWMIGSGCDVITLACNTASAAALHPLRDTYPTTAFVGMEPAIKPAAARSTTGRIGVVATAATFQGELFAAVVDRFAPDMEVSTATCPRWVELVEEGAIEGERAHEEVRRCLTPMLTEGVDVIVLACTHYPELAEVIASVAGPDVEIVDPAPAVARQTTRVALERGTPEGSGSTHLYTTGSHEALARAVGRKRIDGVPALLPLP